MRLNQRKALLTACRVQSYPHTNSRLFERLKSTWLSDLSIDSAHQPFSSREFRSISYNTTLKDICFSCEQLFPSPTFCGFISSVVRSAPTNFPDEYEDARAEGLAKEVKASIKEYHPVTLDFTSIFSHDHRSRNIPLAPNLESNAPLSEEIYESLNNLRILLDGSILYPRCGTKTIGREAADEFWRVCPPDFRHVIWEDFEQHGGVTTTMMQKLEFFRGIRSEGPVEIRSSWKYGDLKPRIYFALGGTTFHASKYVQKIFNQIADSLPPTHTKNRHFPPVQDLEEEDTVVIYDYRAFTSTLQAIIEFIEGLAKFMRGTTVYLVGGWNGVIPCDLGDLLQEYQDKCNFFAEFDLGPILGLDLPYIMAHTCGMLGVPGNIQSSTSLHGIHLSYISNSLNSCKCIGDDAKTYIRFRSFIDELIFEERLQNIGEVSLEKTEMFEYDDEDDYELRAWHYAKRPLLRTCNRVVTFYMATFPTLDCLLGLTDQNRTTIPGSNTLNSRRNKFFSIWLRFLTVIFLEEGISQDEIDFVVIYQSLAFRELKITGYRPGSHEDNEGRFLVPPYFEPQDFGRDPTEKVVEEFLYEEEVLVMSSSNQIFWPMGYVGEVFCSRNCALLSFLYKMGLLEKKLKMEKVSRASVGDQLFALHLLGRLPACYEFTIVQPLPSFVFALMN